MRKKPQPTCMGMPVPLDHRVDPTSDPTSELVITYGCNIWPRQAASLSRLRQQAHNWGGGSVSRGCDPRGCVVCCWCLLLPGCCCCCAAAASTTTDFLRLVTLRTGMIIIELATTAVSIFYLCSLQPRQAAELSRLRQQVLSTIWVV